MKGNRPLQLPCYDLYQVAILNRISEYKEIGRKTSSVYAELQAIIANFVFETYNKLMKPFTEAIYEFNKQNNIQNENKKRITKSNNRIIKNNKRRNKKRI